MLGREQVLVPPTLERRAAVHALLREDRSHREAADILGLYSKTGGRFAAEADPRLLVNASPGQEAGPGQPWINQRWNEGITDADLHRERTGQRRTRQALRPPVPWCRRPLQGRPEPPSGLVTAWLLAGRSASIRHRGPVPDEEYS